MLASSYDIKAENLIKAFPDFTDKFEIQYVETP